MELYSNILGAAVGELEKTGVSPGTGLRRGSQDQGRRAGVPNGCSAAFSWATYHNELIPYPPRDNSSNALLGLPIFHPRLHLASDGPILADGAEQDLHRYDGSGERLWTELLPGRKQSPADPID
jgi:hypothetical protein